MDGCSEEDPPFLLSVFICVHLWFLVRDLISRTPRKSAMLFQPIEEDAMANQRIVHAACPHDCPDTCAMLVEVTDGRATKVSGDDAHPTTRGFLCTKVTRYLERVYHPDRVLYPMRRAGAKGEGRFARISWDEAIAEIARRFGDVAESADGPESILPYSYGGTMGIVQGGSMDRRFFHRLGASLLERTICSAAGGAGLMVTLGSKYGTDMENFHRARL